MSSTNARLIETEVDLTEVSATSPTAPFSLNGASKFSVQVTATAGDSIAHLEGTNVQNPTDDSQWTEIDSFSIADGASDMFEQASANFKWARATIENDDIMDVEANVKILVIGDAI